MSKPTSKSPPPALRASVRAYGSPNRLSAHAARLRVAMTAALAAAVLFSLAAPSSVDAAPPNRPRSPVAERVFYGDLDLNTVAGARTMYRRIHATVSRACALTNSPLLERASAEVLRCRLQAMARAVHKLDAPLVTAEHRRLYAQPPTATAQR